MVNIAGDDDDDFGDLYADVEVQASSAINALQSSMLVQTEVNEVDYNASVGNCNRENAVRGEEDCESESGDDLNILLNDDEGDDDFLNAGCDEDEIEGNGGFIVSDKGNGLGQNSNGSGSGDGEKNSYKVAL